ncbi:hypothetical protein ACM1RC_27580 [Paenibacillus azoreducens]|uniref:hypothetical protein n=1 Tax=Paenibacillus azoreducens TaxID=116718 RepID=UPI0039F53530
MRASQLIKAVQDYIDFYGDNHVSVYNKDGGEDLRITFFDAFKNELSIEVSPVGYLESDDEDDDE